MSNLHKADDCQDRHKWQKEERELGDGFHYYYYICKKCHMVKYPGPELQKIQEYSEKKLFLSVEDWVLLLLYAGKYIAGITHYQKMLFLVFYELAPKENIPTENPCFYGYKYGPYSQRIDEAIDFLIKFEYIHDEGRKSSSKERFYITSKGKKKGKIIFDKLSKKQQNAIREFRIYWDQKTTKGLLKYIYSNLEYKSFLVKSKIIKDLFPGVTIYRRRG